MQWFRRNLFWAVFGLAAILLLACGGFYLWSGIGKNSSVDEEINASKHQLEGLLKANPSHSQANIDQARNSLNQLSKVISQEQKYFTPIPYAKVQGVDFVTVLNSNLFYLHNLAKEHSVKLSDHFAFSFEEQMNKAKFAPGSFPELAEQLADVRLITAQLCAANVNALLSIKRAKTADDAGTSPYCHELPIVKKPDLGMAAFPYEVTFYAFSTELAQVLDKLCSAEQFLAPRLIALDHEAEPNKLDISAAPGAPPNRSGTLPPPNRRPVRRGAGNAPVSRLRPGAYSRAAQLRRAAPLPPRPPGTAEEGVLVTVLDESLCRVTLVIDVMKPIPTP